MAAGVVTSGQVDYRARLYDTYLTTHAGLDPAGLAVPAIRQNIVSRLPKDENIRILDIGCGQGELLITLRQAGYPHAQGIDVSREQVAAAAARGLTVKEGDLFPFLTDHAACFDAICAIDVIEHFDKPDVLPLFEVIALALRPGGMLIGQVPNGESPFMGRYRYGDFTHGTAFTQRSIRQIARAMGFADVSVFPTEPVAHGVPSAVRLAVWKLASLAMKVALFAETGVLRGHLVTQNLVFTARMAQSATQVQPGSDA